MSEFWDRLWNLPPAIYGWIALFSTISLVLGMLAVPWLLVRIPHDYFLTHRVYLSDWKLDRPVLRALLLLLLNLLGIVLCLLGIVMLVAPGQGVFTMLLGISLTTFPGKRQLELSLLRCRGVLRSINWMRSKSDRKPLKIPDELSEGAEN